MTDEFASLEEVRPIVVVRVRSPSREAAEPGSADVKGDEHEEGGTSYPGRREEQEDEDESASIMTRRNETKRSPVDPECCTRAADPSPPREAAW